MKLINSISFLLCGVAIGWLVGLSASSVIQTVITSVLSIVASLITLLYSLQNGESKEKPINKFGTINIGPFALFLIGLSIAATIGLYARTNDWFGINPQSFKEKWEIKNKDATGIIQKLYESLHNREFNNRNSEGVFYSNSQTCEEILQINDFEALLTKIKSLGPEWVKFADSVQQNVPIQKQSTVLKEKIIVSCQ